MSHAESLRACLETLTAADPDKAKLLSKSSSKIALKASQKSIAKQKSRREKELHTLEDQLDAVKKCAEIIADELDHSASRSLRAMAKKHVFLRDEMSAAGITLNQDATRFLEKLKITINGLKLQVAEARGGLKASMEIKHSLAR